MKLWTVQNKLVLEAILEDGAYYPEYDKGKNNLPLKAAYKELLANYNVINKREELGLIFAFHSLNGGQEVEEVEELYQYFQLRPELENLFSSGNLEDYLILELDIDQAINFLPIDFNDYIKLSLWANYQRNYNEELLTIFKNEHDARKEILAIKKYLPEGNLTSGLGSFIQGHYHKIEAGDILAVNEMIDFKTGELLPLGEAGRSWEKKIGE